MLKHICLLALVALPIMTASARADTLVCTLNVKRGDWLAPDAVILRDANGTPTHILDGLIAEFESEDPIPVKVTSDKANSVSFEWRLEMLNRAGQRSKFLFRGTLFKADLAFHESARPVGYSNNFSAVGKCAVQ